MADSVLIINEKDNVAVALRDLEAGEEARFRGEVLATALEPVPTGHKIAIRDVERGGEIIKYGEPVGISTMVIRRGAWVHTHNLESGRWKTA